jgi:putative peptidoglycan lipid II flippase
VSEFAAPLDGSEQSRKPLPPTDQPAAADEPTPVEKGSRSLAGAFFVSLGIFVTKIFGVIRQAFVARYLGATVAADVYNAATRIPNLLQNLFGEGALSASFVPVYSRLRVEGKEVEAGRLAGAVFATLALVVGSLSLLGVIFAPQILPLFAPGFKGAERDMAISFVRILFPAIAILVMASWCLGVLNSHRKYFLSYSAPIAWSVIIIAALVWFGPRRSVDETARMAAWAFVIGAGAQFLVQVPTVLKLVKHLRIRFNWQDSSLRTVLKNFVPVGISRGIVQISNTIDQAISTLLPHGMISMLTYATTISYVPVSMFGIGISAAELTEMSSVSGSDVERARQIRERLNGGLRQIAFFVIPSALAMLAAGDTMAAALFQHGLSASRQQTLYTWGILAGSSVGLLASTSGRLYSSTYYALQNTKTPLVYACVRVALTLTLGYLFAIPLPKLIGIDPHWGGAGLTVSFGIAGWTEFALLRRGMNKRIGVTGAPLPFVGRLWAAAVAAGLVAFGIKSVLHVSSTIITAVVVLGAFGLVYLGATIALGIPEAKALVRRAKAIARR